MAERAIYDKALEKDENKTALDSEANDTPIAVYEKPNFLSNCQEETNYNSLAVSASTKRRRQGANQTEQKEHEMCAVLNRIEPNDRINVENAVSIAVSPNYTSGINQGSGQGQAQGQGQALSESVLYEAGSQQIVCLNTT